MPQPEPVERAKHANVALDESRAFGPDQQRRRTGTLRGDDVLWLEREYEAAIACVDLRAHVFDRDER